MNYRHTNSYEIQQNSDFEDLEVCDEFQTESSRGTRHCSYKNTTKGSSYLLINDKGNVADKEQFILELKVLLFRSKKCGSIMSTKSQAMNNGITLKCFQIEEKIKDFKFINLFEAQLKDDWFHNESPCFIKRESMH